MNRIKMKEIIKTFGVFLVVAVVACGLVLPQSASAALPAPNFMPGFPMLAGPQVIIMWGPVPGAAKYNVYMNGTKIGESPAMQIIHPAPTAGGEYKFTIRALDASGAESPDSAPGIVRIVVVEAPKDLSALPAGNRIAIRWNSAPGAIIYDVFRRKKGEGDYKLLQSVQETRYSDSSIEKNVTYEYVIASKDNTGKTSPMSDMVEAGVQEVVRDKGFGGFKMNPLPLKEIEELRIYYDGFPVDIDIRGNAGVVTVGGRLVYHPDLSASTDYRVIFKEAADAAAEEGVTNDATKWIKLAFKGIDIDEEGYIYGPALEKIYKIDPEEEEVVQVFITPKPEKDQFQYLYHDEVRSMANTPLLTDVVVGLDGTVYASDNGNSRVVMFSPDGEFLGTLGWEEGQAPSERDWLVAKANYMSFSSEGLLFVNALFDIAVFDPVDGTRLFKIGRQGDTVGHFGAISGHAFDDEGRLWVTDIKQGSLQIFAENSGEEIKGWPWVPVRVATAEDGKSSPKIPKMLSIAFGPMVGKPDQKHAYIISSPLQASFIYEILAK